MYQTASRADRVQFHDHETTVLCGEREYNRDVGRHRYARGGLIATLLTIVVAVFFGGMGIVALWHPTLVLGLFGTAVTTSEGRNEVRAVYGGYGVAMGILLIGSLVMPTFRPGVLLCVAAAMLGMAIGRLISFGIDGRAGFYPLLFLGVEAAVVAFLLGAVFVGARNRHRYQVS